MVHLLHLDVYHFFIIQLFDLPSLSCPQRNSHISLWNRYAMFKFKKLFPKFPAVIGMIHVKALPGTPCYQSGSLASTVQLARKEAKIYADAGLDGIILENMHDIPYMNRNVGPEITACMSTIGQAVKDVIGDIPCGVQILAGCNKEALAVAKAASLQFIRAEGFVFSHVADEGIINADAGELLRYRKHIDAEDVLVFTDIKKKHSSHSITADLNLVDAAHAASFFLSDGLIITGTSTGHAANPKELSQVTERGELPVLVGSGVSVSNYKDYLEAHGLIVGSYFKHSGRWDGEIDEDKVHSFMTMLHKEQQYYN